MRKTVISEYIQSLDDLERKLIDYYIYNDYISKVRTGQGFFNNFLYEHNSKKGVEIAKEIIKFKKLQFFSGYLSITMKLEKNKKNTRN